jgi:hypothetical protein
MATRGSIAIQHQDGTVSSIYCHWDNYLSHTGKILFDHYNNMELVEELVSHGSISSISVRANPIGTHDAKYPEEGTTVYFGRDRGEENVSPELYSDIEDYVMRNDYQEYNYLWTEYDDQEGNRVEGWLVNSYAVEHLADKVVQYGFVPLSDALLNAKGD